MKKRDGQDATAQKEDKERKQQNGDIFVSHKRLSAKF